MIKVFIYPDNIGAVICPAGNDGRHYRGSLEEIKNNFLLDMSDRGYPSALFEFVNMGKSYH